MATLFRHSLPTLAAIALLLSLPACTKRQAYEGTRSSLRLECDRAPTRDELERCLQRQSLGFEDYERQRAEDAAAARKAEATAISNKPRETQ